MRIGKKSKPLSLTISIELMQGLKPQSSHYYLGDLTYRALRSLMSPNDVSRLGPYLSLKDNEEDEQMAVEHINAGWPCLILPN